MRRPYGCALHVSGVGSELVCYLVLNDKGLYRLCTGDTLVVVAGDAGIQLTQLTVQPCQPVQAQRDKHNGKRNDHNDRKRQLHVYREHDGNRADYVRRVPYAVHHYPRHKRAYP